MSRIDCPDFHGWQTLLEGDRSEHEIEDLARHLETCGDCRQTLEMLAVTPADWEDTARGLDAPHWQEGGEPALRHVVERLKEEPLPAGEVDLSFLQPPDDPNLLGLLEWYQVQEVIGRGGMGVVLKAFDPHLHRLVAIKVLDPSLAGNAIARRRFLRETQAAAAVCHDHVVAVHAVSEVNGLPYLVMQYIAGESLQARLDREGPLAIVEVVRIGLQTASGLAAAHAQGLTHRDIKPANLLLENGLSRVKITDFGLARMSDDVALTQNGVVAGTPEYMAPEQARGEIVDHRADLFSLGSLLYACCTGKPPFRGSTAMSVLSQVSDKEPRAIRSLNPDIPAWLETFIARLMAKDPAQRLQSASEVAVLLESYLAHLHQPNLPAPQLSGFSVAESEPTPTEWHSEGSLRAGLQYKLMGLMVLAVGLGLAWTWAATQNRRDDKAFLSQKYYQSFKGEPGMPQGLEFVYGPEAQQLVRFDPEGMRITLPAGHVGERRDIGVATQFNIQGDFEVTVSFEVLDETQLTDKASERVTLAAILEKPGRNMASLSRTMSAEKGATFFTWKSWSSETAGKEQEQGDHFPTRTKSGCFRMVRCGAYLSFYAAEGPTSPFVFLTRYLFGTEDLRSIGITGSTHGDKAALNVVITDLRIRAETLAGVPVTRASKGSMSLALLCLGIFLALGLALAAWLKRRFSGRAGTWAASELAQPVVVSGSMDLRRLRRQLRLPALGLAFLAVGLMVWAFTAPWAGNESASVGIAQPFLPENTGKADIEPNRFRQTFRGHPLDERLLSYSYLEAGQEIKEEAEGLRLALPANSAKAQAAGVVFKSPIRGDCEITVSYDLPPGRPPTTGYGAGVSLFMQLATPRQDGVTLACFRRKNALTYKCQKRKCNEQGLWKYDTNLIPSGAASGKLRLARQGSVIRFLVAEQTANEFRELHKLDVGSEDLVFIRAGAESIFSDKPVEVRLHEVDFKTATGLEDSLLDISSRDVSADTSEGSASRIGARLRLAAVLVGLGLLLWLALATWLWIRNGRRIGTAASAAAQSAPATSTVKGSTVLFSCADCKKRLRVKRERIGTKVKCPQCGKVVLVPESRESEPDRTPS